jgi:hypothetical protein
MLLLPFDVEKQPHPEGLNSEALDVAHSQKTAYLVNEDDPLREEHFLENPPRLYKGASLTQYIHYGTIGKR